MSNVAGGPPGFSKQIHIYVAEASVAAVVDRALGQEFAVSVGANSDDLLHDLERLRPDVFLGGPLVVGDSARVSSLTGGSLVLLGDVESQHLVVDGGESEHSPPLLAIALMLASVPPPLDQGPAGD